MLEEREERVNQQLKCECKKDAGERGDGVALRRLQNGQLGGGQ